MFTGHNTLQTSVLWLLDASLFALDYMFLVLLHLQWSLFIFKMRKFVVISQVANNLLEQNYPRCVFYKQIFFAVRGLTFMCASQEVSWQPGIHMNVIQWAFL